MKLSALICGLSLALTVCACGDDDEPTPTPAPDVSEVPDEGPGEFEDIVDIVEPDEGPQDVEFPWDLPEVDLIEADPDVPAVTPGGFDDCPTLGISAHWEGKWEGIVTYSLDNEDTGVPDQGLFLVDGDLEFDIQCLDKKLLVSGALVGIAEAAGEVGQHPFAAKLFGDFNYIDRTIKADIIDGEVRLFKVISVFFAGNFDGAVKPDGTFQGTWDAVQTSNDLNVEGDAEAYGTWTAFPAPQDDEPEDPDEP